MLLELDFDGYTLLVDQIDFHLLTKLQRCVVSPIDSHKIAINIKKQKASIVKRIQILLGTIHDMTPTYSLVWRHSKHQKIFLSFS